MSGAIPPLPQYAFMAWRSVTKKKAQGQLYLYLTFTFNMKQGDEETQPVQRLSYGLDDRG